MPESIEDRAVAVLLAIAAVFAALLGARASFLSGEATGGWQTAVRQEVKRSAAALQDIRYAYTVAAVDALRYATAMERVEAYRAAAAAAPEAARPNLLAEAQNNQFLADAIRPTLDLADPKYALPDGGFDQPRYLADLRNSDPDLVAIDPSLEQAAGDIASRQAVGTMMATIPIGATFLMGALAQAFPRRRRWLLALGVAGLGAAAVITVIASVRT